MVVIVQGLSVDGGDGSEGQLAVVTFGHVVHLGHYLILVHTRTDETGSGDVHVSSDVAGAFYLGYFLGSLMIALFHHGADERHGAFLVGRRQAQPVHLNWSEGRVSIMPTAAAFSCKVGWVPIQTM